MWLGELDAHVSRRRTLGVQASVPAAEPPASRTGPPSTLSSEARPPPALVLTSPRSLVGATRSPASRVRLRMFREDQELARGPT